MAGRRIGRSLNERYGVRRSLSAERARELLLEALPSMARPIVEVRARGARMVACVIVRADEASVRMCRTLGFAMKPEGTGVFGLPGHDAARAFPGLSEGQRTWLARPCAERQTKVLLLAEGGVGLLSMLVENGEVSVTAPSATDEGGGV